jgi:hypothetical protein
VSKGALPALIRLQRQISYFGDKEGLNGLMKHVGDEEANCSTTISMEMMAHDDLLGADTRRFFGA